MIPLCSFFQIFFRQSTKCVILGYFLKLSYFSCTFIFKYNNLLFQKDYSKLITKRILYSSFRMKLLIVQGIILGPILYIVFIPDFVYLVLFKNVLVLQLLESFVFILHILLFNFYLVEWFLQSILLVVLLQCLTVQFVDFVICHSSILADYIFYNKNLIATIKYCQYFFGDLMGGCKRPSNN